MIKSYSSFPLLQHHSGACDLCFGRLRPATGRGTVQTVQVGENGGLRAGRSQRVAEVEWPHGSASLALVHGTSM